MCNAFPQIYDYIGYANRGEHSTGKALDLMISDVPAGRGGEGWRGMENRGSATANHMDHVHVSTY